MACYWVWLTSKKDLSSNKVPFSFVGFPANPAPRGEGGREQAVGGVHGRRSLAGWRGPTIQSCRRPVLADPQQQQKVMRTRDRKLRERKIWDRPWSRVMRSAKISLLVIACVSLPRILSLNHLRGFGAALLCGSAASTRIIATLLQYKYGSNNLHHPASSLLAPRSILLLPLLSLYQQRLATFDQN